MLRWVLLLQSKHLIFSNKIKANIELNGNFIKKLSSGGDPLVARNHCQGEISFVPQFLACVMSNDLNKIKPYDDAVDERVRVISYTKSFVDNPTNQYELLKDRNIETEMGSDRFKRLFLILFIKRYSAYVNDGCIETLPESVKYGKEEWIENAEETKICFAISSGF